MDKFITVKNLKREPYMQSSNIFCAEHCQMDVILEAVSEMDGINSLVVGVGECVYYSKKIQFPENCKNWAYQLSNDEIVFGDISGIENALEALSDGKNKVLCIFTCIPCLMNIDADSLRSRFPDVAFLSAPDYKGISAYDVLAEFYYLLFFNEESGKSNSISVWDWQSNGSFEDVRRKLQARTHIVKNASYLKLLQNLSEKYNINVIDDTRFNTVEFYDKHADELNIDRSSVDEMVRLLEILASYGKINVRGTCAVDFAVCLNALGANIGGIVMNGKTYNDRTYRLLKELPEDTFISFEQTASFPENNALEVDFSPYRDEIAEKSGIERLLFMLRKAVELCH